MSNTRSSRYPLLNIAEDGVHGVISLDCLVDSWVWRPCSLFFFLILIMGISPLIIALLLRWLNFLIFYFIIWAWTLSWVGGDACKEEDGWSCAFGGSLDSLGHTSPMDMFLSATHGASSSPISSRSTCSTWEPLVSSNTMSQETSTSPEDLLKTLYALVFESYPSKKPSTTLGANFDFLPLLTRIKHLLPKTLKYETLGFLPVRSSYDVFLRIQCRYNRLMA
jgi:hypothetical protein